MNFLLLGHLDAGVPSQIAIQSRGPALLNTGDEEIDLGHRSYLPVRDCKSRAMLG
jgi:hypothetical protein